MSAAASAVQTSLMVAPVVGVEPTPLGTANALLDRWQHRLGTVNRPFRSEPWLLAVDGEPVAVAVSCSVVSSTVAGYRCQEVVELARLCASPDAPWANRVLLRLWREVLAPRWALWPVKAAISYSHNGMHRGDLYRFDGWTKVREDAGANGSESNWGRAAYGSRPQVIGSKTLWIWKYQEESE